MFCTVFCKCIWCILYLESAVMVMINNGTYRFVQVASSSPNSATNPASHNGSVFMQRLFRKYTVALQIPLTSLGLTWTVILVWKKGNINRTVSVLQYCVAFQQCTLHNHNEQFFQVGLLDRALISLGLALSPPSTAVSSDFMVLCKCLKNYTYFTLPCSVLSLGGLVDWPTVVLQCFNTVG